MAVMVRIRLCTGLPHHNHRRGGRLPPPLTHLGLPGAAALARHGDGHAIMVLVLEAVLVGVAPNTVRPRAPPNDRGDNDENIYGKKRCPGLVCTASAFQEESSNASFRCQLTGETCTKQQRENTEHVP